MPFSPLIQHLCRLTLLSGVLCAANGCNILGAIADKAPRPDIEAAYKGMAGQTIGVMVYADSTLLMDWPNLQLDLANSIQAKLREAQKAESEEFKGSTFPFEPRSIIRYQREHPGIEAVPITDTAPKLGVKRLIYVEVNAFSTRAEGTIAMYLGNIDVTMKVVEIESGKAKVVYTDPNIRVKFPKSAPKEGEINKNDRFMYVGTIETVSTEMAIRFFKHPDTSR